jgi:hypothetical protein
MQLVDGMGLTGESKRLMDKSLRDFQERECAWWKNDRRGRWVVLEPGPGRLLDDAPRHIREHIDLITPQRARRFRSLSRARAFAREVDGVVRRWHRKMPRYFMGRKYMSRWRYETNPWKSATRPMYWALPAMSAQL